MSPGTRAAVALAASALACRHGGRPAQAPPEALPLLAATPGELAARLGDAAAVASVKGRLAIAFEERAGADPRTCSAVLAARSPRAASAPPGLYLKAHRTLVPTLFTLVSDGRRFWLHVPRDNVVYTGPLARGAAPAPEVHGARLDARDLFRALFLEPIGDGDALEVAEEPAAYAVSVRREGRLVRRLWIERRRLTVAREAYYAPDGGEERSIERDRYVDVGGRLYPERLRVRDAATGAALTLEFEKLALDPPDLPADAFRARTPAGARVVAIAGEEDAP